MFIITKNGRNTYEADYDKAVTIWSDEANKGRGRTDLTERLIIDGVTQMNIIFTLKK